MFNDLCIVETFKETQLITVKKKKNNLYHLSHILLLKKEKEEALLGGREVKVVEDKETL